MNRKMITVLQVPFDRVTQRESLEMIAETFGRKKPLFCVTPNPEMCLLAQKDRDFLKILQQADLSLPDGFGILWAARYLSGKRNFFTWLWTLFTPHLTLKNSPFPERVTGTDMMKAFCERSKNRSIFLLGASPQVNKALAKKLKAQGNDIVGHFSGDDSEGLEAVIRSNINASSAEVLFVAFGAPKQEKWIARNLRFLPSIRLAMGVGGAFDFLAGEKKRAPKFMRGIGLEWLYRLLIEPRRIRRILNATVIFPWKIF